MSTLDLRDSLGSGENHDPASLSTLYFAYGSNMLGRRLRSSDRAPSAELVSTGRLGGYSLRFHKRGSDGSGKCDAFRTRNSDDDVHGALYRLGSSDLERLDRTEGRGYDRVAVRVNCDDGAVEAATYVARSSFIELRLDPFDWYLALVIAGARQHQLPPTYVERLLEIVTVPDPDSARRSQATSILPAAPT